MRDRLDAVGEQFRQLAVPAGSKVRADIDAVLGKHQFGDRGHGAADKAPPRVPHRHRQAVRRQDLGQPAVGDRLGVDQDTVAVENH